MIKTGNKVIYTSDTHASYTNEVATAVAFSPKKVAIRFTNGCILDVEWKDILVIIE